MGSSVAEREASSRNGKLGSVGSVSNDAKHDVQANAPYVLEVKICGTANFLFHRWSCDAVAEKAAAKKGSAQKKSDNLESYVYRNEDGELCIPGEYLRMAIIGAAKYQQDPRSPRKSAMDLFKAGVVSLTDLASTGKKDWDSLDRRRVMIQRNGITRERPCLHIGWESTFLLQVLTPEYISEDLLAETITNAGRLIGIGDFRPTFGRFRIVSIKRQ